MRSAWRLSIAMRAAAAGSAAPDMRSAGVPCARTRPSLATTIQVANSTASCIMVTMTVVEPSRSCSCR
jgi:hypothetical protein